ncbi:MAG: alpha/beta hydrolase [Oligoflexia bacterium]|nr:alpha/beta hydrolase [Oligoflexia bacterium]
MRNILCISGFLGVSADWDFLNQAKFNVFPYAPTDFEENFEYAAKQINELAKKNKCDWIMGYSMGGRLALSALCAQNNFKGAIIISANLGLKSDYDRRKRTEADQKWSEKFQMGSWPELINLWNSQVVFKNSNTPLRKESDYTRSHLERALRQFSLGRQPDFREALKKVNTPVLFVAGSRDEKYKFYAEEAKRLNPKFDSLILEAGHRVIFDINSQKLNTEFIKFMERV